SSGEPYLNSEILDREAQESTTRELIKELYSMGASAIDIYAIGVPLDVIIRFSNELNIELPKDLIQTQQILSEAGTSSFMLSSSQNPVFGQNTFSTQIFPNSTNVQNTPLIQNIPSLQPLAPNAQFLAPVNSVVRDQPNMMFAADSTLPVQSSSSIMFSGSQQDQISALFQGQYSNISSSSPSSSQNVQNMLNIQQTPALLVLQNSQQTALSTNPQWETPALGLIIPTDTNIMSNNNATHQMMASSIDTKATEQSLQASSMSPHFMNTTSTGATPPILATTNIDEQSSLGMECDVCTEDVPPQGSHVSIPSKGKNKAVELNNTISQMSSIALINHSSSQNRANTTKPFSSKQVNNFIIDLSDESDGEQPVSDLAQQTKTAYKDSEEMQINAKQKLKEKEMEIRRMNELIASKMEMLKKKNATSVSTSSDTKANSIFNINDHEELQQSASQNQINNNVGTLKESRNDVTTTFMTEVSFENNQESTLTNETELEEINSNIKKATNDLE
ncbi:14151_t:CDS:1, partial [Acaulospora morrowiae]